MYIMDIFVSSVISFLVMSIISLILCIPFLVVSVAGALLSDDYIIEAEYYYGEEDVACKGLYDQNLIYDCSIFMCTPKSVAAFQAISKHDTLHNHLAT